MTRELLSSGVTLPVWRDITSLNHLERGEEGGGKGKEKGKIEKRRGKKEDLRKKEWGSLKGKVWEVDSLQDVARITNQ